MIFLWLAIFSLLITALNAAVGFTASGLQILSEINSRKNPGERQRFIRLLFFITLASTILFAGIGLPSLVNNAPNASPTMSNSQADTSTMSANTRTDTPTPGTTPTLTPTPLPTATPTPSHPSPGTQLFPKNGVSWFNGWTGGSDWYTSGSMMLNNGQQVKSMSIAPYHPGDDNVSDYTVDVEMQLNRWSDDMGSDSFGMIVRSPDGRQGYTFAVCVSALTLASCGKNDKEIYVSNGTQNIAENPYLPRANDWHHYRMEVQGNQVRVLIDGTKYLDATDNAYASGGEVGLWSDRSQISIRSFTVTAL